MSITVWTCGFILGIIVGSFCGVCCMALCNAASKGQDDFTLNDNKKDDMKG